MWKCNPFNVNSYMGLLKRAGFDSKMDELNLLIAASKCYCSVNKEDKLNLDKLPSVNFDWSLASNISGLSIIKIICNVDTRSFKQRSKLEVGYYHI